LLQGHDNSDFPTRCFQILEKKRVNLVVRTFDYTRPKPSEWVLQSLDIWRGTSVSVDSVLLDVFKVTEPCKVDIVEVFGASAAERAHFKVWEPSESDLEGCIALINPTCIASQRMLSDTSVPVLCLIDSLGSAGYMGMSSLQTHTPTSGLFFDNRNILSSRSYLQAVLASAHIFGRGTRK
jgi:hypothetical protein